MDQIKAMVPAIKQNSFWVMCVGILITSLVSWWMSTATLKSQKEARNAEIKTSFDGVQNIRTQFQLHPNNSTKVGMEALIAQVSRDVAAGWQFQYDQQATVLVWPASFDQQFHDAVNKLRPIEAIPVNAGGQISYEHDLPNQLRLLYRNYIEEDLPILAKTIGTEWRASSERLGDGGGAAGGAAAGAGIAGGAAAGQFGTDNSSQVTEDRSVVAWSQGSQQEVLEKHFGFIARTEVPSTLEVLYAQEDMWVLQNIMDIIREANDKAEARHEAAIKEIHFVRIGRSALGMAGSVTAVSETAAANQGMSAGPAMGGMGEAAPAMGGGMDGMGGGAPTPGNPAGAPAGAPAGGAVMPGGGGALTASNDPADGRYVDDKYQPLPATRLRTALTSRSPEDALLAVAKRMPVRLRFKVDQRRLHRLLAECGNSRLPVEVRQVRINRPPAAGGGGSGDGMSMGGAAGGMGGMGGMGGEAAAAFGGMQGGDGMGLFAGGRSGTGNAISDASIDPNLIDVELYGIVYIYNPVNSSQLGLAEPATTAMAPTVPATPVASPPASGVPAATTGASVTGPGTTGAVAGS
jgi:hypothetical protein